MKLQPLEEQTPFPPALPWQRCGGGYSHWWWQRRGGPCAAAATARSRFFPDGMRCGGEFGPPKDSTVEKETHLLKKEEQTAKQDELAC